MGGVAISPLGMQGSASSISQQDFQIYQALKVTSVIVAALHMGNLGTQHGRANRKSDSGRRGTFVACTE